MHIKIKIHYSWLHELLQIAATIENNQLYQPHTHCREQQKYPCKSRKYVNDKNSYFTAL